MKYDLYELLNTAIFTKTAFILVEGKDDAQIYSRIAKKINKKIDIYPVNIIDEYSSGCDNVIKAIHKLQAKFEERKDNIDKVLGIIDRDVRPYRPLSSDNIDYKTLKGLFILKYYSIETYFATKNNLKKLIEKLTYANQNIITEEVLNIVENNFNKITNELYTISLEALKNSCLTDYNSIVGYDDDKIKEEDRRKYIFRKLQSKKTELKNFADKINVNINDLKQVCKGKWYLYNYIIKTLQQIKHLKIMCKKAEILQCKSCKVENFDDCDYKYKGGYQISGIYNDIFEYIDETECQDIIQRMTGL